MNTYILEALEALAVNNLSGFQDAMNRALHQKVASMIEARSKTLYSEGFEPLQETDMSPVQFWDKHADRAWAGLKGAKSDHERRIFDKHLHKASREMQKAMVKGPIRRSIEHGVGKIAKKVKKRFSGVGESTMPVTEKIGPIKKGALHRDLGIPQDEKIPLSTLNKEKRSGSAKERKRANFAINARKWHHH